jgi:uncharacterized alkaline shock family protein YloU
MASQYHRQPNDSVKVHRHVLQTIVRAAALNVEGVDRLGHASGTLDRWLGLDPSAEGVQIAFEDEQIIVTIELVVDAHHNLYEISQQVQSEIVRTMREYVGLEVKSVNVYIADVVFGA